MVHIVRKSVCMQVFPFEVGSCALELEAERRVYEEEIFNYDSIGRVGGGKVDS